MYKKFFKGMVSLLLIYLFSGCTTLPYSGNWENIVEAKEGDGKVITNLTILVKPNNDFSGTMETKTERAENIKVALKNVNFSGYINGNTLVISQVDETTDNAYSTLRLSGDGKFLTLMPGGMKFYKK